MADLTPWGQIGAGVAAAGGTILAIVRILATTRRNRPQSDQEVGFKLRDELREDAERLREQLTAKESELQHWREIAEAHAHQLTVAGLERDMARAKVQALEAEVSRLRQQLEDCLRGRTA